MSNIEENIKRCEQLIKPEHANWIGISNQLAIAHLIERIKELEEENNKKQKYINMASEVVENSILKQKVKDVLQNNRNEIFSITYLDNEQFKPYTMQIDRINKIEKELLEEK